jgi:hypothetical protein
MAAPADIVYELRTTGADTNSGGFAASGGGTDYTLQDAPQYAFTDLVIDAVTNTKVTSASHSFVAADVGNTLRITAGTGFTTGVFYIVSVAGGAATLDRSAGTLGSTGGTWKEGGALASLSAVNSLNASVFPAGTTIYVKATANYNMTAGVSFNQSGTRTTPYTLIGYTSTRTDGGQVTLNQQTNTFSNLLGMTGNYWHVRNFITQGNNNVDYGFAPNALVRLENCKAINCKTRGFYVGSDYTHLFNCFAQHCGNTTASATTSGGFFFLSNVGCTAEGCEAYDCYVSFAGNGGMADLFHCVSRNDNSHGVVLQGTSSCIFWNLTIRGAAGDGIRFEAAASGENFSAVNCLFSSITGAALRSVTTNYSTVTDWGRRMRYCAFYSCGAKVNVPAGLNEITLTADPFTSSTDSSLNSTAGGGAALANAGWPGAYQSGSATGYLDVGAVQNNTGSITTTTYVPKFTGRRPLMSFRKVSDASAKGFSFEMRDATTGALMTSLGTGDLTVERSKNLGAFAAGTGTKAVIGSGAYGYTPSAGDLDTQGEVTFKITATGANPEFVVIEVGAYDGFTRVDANATHQNGTNLPNLSGTSGLPPVDVQAINDDTSPANTLAADIADIGADVDAVEAFGAPPSVAAIAAQITTDHGAGSYVDTGAPPSAAAVAAQVDTTLSGTHGAGSWEGGSGGGDVNVISWNGDAVPDLSPTSGLIPVDVQAVNDSATAANDLAGVPTNVSTLLTRTDDIMTGVDQANDALADLIATVNRVLALSQDNWVIDDLVYDGNGNMTDGVVYCYDDRTNVITHDKVTGLVYKYNLHAVTTSGLLVRMKQIRESVP